MARTTESPGPSIPPIEAFLKEPIPLVERDAVPEQWHVFDNDSAQSIRAALAARRPLLVRGEPGVGKTQLAAAAARVLKRPLVTRVVDSRTESRDLLWTFDAVMRLADAQMASLFLTRDEERKFKPRRVPRRTTVFHQAESPQGTRRRGLRRCRARSGGRSTGKAL